MCGQIDMLWLGTPCTRAFSNPFAPARLEGHFLFFSLQTDSESISLLIYRMKTLVLGAGMGVDELVFRTDRYMVKNGFSTEAARGMLHQALLRPHL